MKRIRPIARLEIVHAMRDRRLVVLSAVVVLLAVASGALAWQEVRARSAERAAAAELDNHVWDHQGEKNPHTAAHFGRLVVKPVGAMAAFDRGLDPYLGTVVFTEGHRQNFAAARPAEDSASVLRLGDWTPASIAQIALPLVAILLGFSSVAREREKGTFRIVKSLGVSGSDYLVGKLAGLAVLLGALLLPIALGAILLSLFGPGAEPLLARGARAVLLVMIYGLYLGVFLFLAVGVSAATRGSAQALVLLLGVWVIAVLLMPRMSASVAASLAPEPEANTFFLNVEERLARFQPGNKYRTRLEEVKTELLKEYDVETVEELPINFSGVSLQVLDEYETEGFQEEFDELWAVYDRQTSLKRIAGVLSPAIPLRELSPAIAGTSLDNHRHFVNAVENYRRDYVKHLNNDMRDNAGPKGFDYKVDEAFWQAVPSFAYQPMAFGTTLAQNGLPLTMLLLWVAASGAFAHYAFARRFSLD